MAVTDHQDGVELVRRSLAPGWTEEVLSISVRVVANMVRTSNERRKPSTSKGQPLERRARM